MTGQPQWIGPYRILSRLGAGGMGEVFLAQDERLGRRVALKRIRPEFGVTEEHRERFRREARLAAGLNHSAIVQVYDLLTEGENECIVLEYVEGETLRDRTAGSPMEISEALRVAREIACGLAEAHRNGVVHRDLKSENVLVTASGQAKISDFGIAKRIGGESDPALTRNGSVLGTYRAMSPEQARGETVDHRSDLFSFGVLLYEVLAGRTPFSGENELATLDQIIRQRQIPVRTLRPAVPEELSNLVDHLLEKQPSLRPRSAGEIARDLDEIATAAGLTGTGAPAERTLFGEPTILPSLAALPTVRTVGPEPSAGTTLAGRRARFSFVAAIVLLGLAGLASYRMLQRPAEPLYVAVLVPEIQGDAGNLGAGNAELITSGVRVAMVRALLALEGLSPKSFEEVDAIRGTPRAVARAVSADEVISTSLGCGADICRITLSRIRGEDASLVWSESFEVAVDDLSHATRAAASQIRRAYADHRPRSGTSDLTVSGRDLRELLEIRRGFASGQSTPEKTLASLAALRSRAPQFVDAYLFESDVARRRFFHSRDRNDLERAFRLVRQARDLAPGDPQTAVQLFAVALYGGDLKQAEEALEEIERLMPGDVRCLQLRAQLLDARGQPEEALTLMQTAARRRPSWWILADLAQMEYQKGRISEAREHLKRLLQRSPGNLQGLSLLARIELFNGDLRQALALYRELAGRSPGPAELSNLALANLLLGRYQDSADVCLRLVEQEPRNPFFVLNLADSYALLGRVDDARALYRRVLELIEEDPAATTAQFFTTQAQALAHLGRGKEAVAAVQKALRLAPEDGPVAYEASLVYALLGENSSAMATAEAALRRGLELRWFDLPWFKPLRRQPDFQLLLRSRSEARPG